jgi:hypothetical protein
MTLAGFLFIGAMGALAPAAVWLTTRIGYLPAPDENPHQEERAYP